MNVVWSRVTILRTRSSAALSGRRGAPAGRTGATKRPAFSSMVRGPAYEGTPGEGPERAAGAFVGASPEPEKAASDAICSASSAARAATSRFAASSGFPLMPRLY